NRDHLRIRRVDGRDLVERHFRAVILDPHRVEQMHRGAAGADGGNRGAEIAGGLFHAGKNLLDDGAQGGHRGRSGGHGVAPDTGRGGGSGPMREPPGSPRATRTMLPGCSRLNTITGIWLSRQSETADISSTRKLRSMKSCYSMEAKRLAPANCAGSASYTPSTL